MTDPLVAESSGHEPTGGDGGVAERMPVRRCPRCGAAAPDRYCGRCGTDMDQAWAADAPLFTHQRSGWSTGTGDPDRTVETGPFGGWAGVPGPVTADSPTLVLSAGTAEAAGLLPGWAEAPSSSAGASGPGSRRRAVLAVLAVAAATAVVLVIALLVAPGWGAKPSDRSSVVPPGPRGSGTATSATDSTGSTAPSTTSAVAPVDPATGTGSPTVTTVTVTTRGPGTTSPSTAPRTSAPRTKPPRTSAPRTKTPSTTPRTSRSTPVPLPNLGVPHQDIACQAGFVVQMAAELTPAAFSQRVTELRVAGQLPQESRVAVAASSCRIFDKQRTGLVLYAGPFSGRYDGCAARLAGPPDAYIKGTSPGTAGAYVSCLCPADPAGIPRILDPGQQGVWVGELQRILAARLNSQVPDVAGQRGVYTPGTRTAVMDFQRRAQLVVDGKVGPQTWRALQAAEC